MIAIKDRYIGLPFEEYDCWQLICLYYGCELGIALPTHATRYRDAQDKSAIKDLYAAGVASRTWFQVNKPRYPDIAVFKIAGQLWHAGILLGSHHMLHTQKGCGSVVERYDNARWKNRLHGFYSYQRQL